MAQKERIVRFDIANPVSEVLPVKDLKNLIAIDFDMKNNCVYFADILTDKIGVSIFNQGQVSIGRFRLFNHLFLFSSVEAVLTIRHR